MNLLSSSPRTKKSLGHPAQRLLGRNVDQWPEYRSESLPLIIHLWTFKYMARQQTILNRGCMCVVTGNLQQKCGSRNRGQVGNGSGRRSRKQRHNFLNYCYYGCIIEATLTPPLPLSVDISSQFIVIRS